MLNIKQKPVSDFSNDLIDLIKSLEQKRIPTKYLYDDIGSKLFEKICDTNEYYLTRTEKKILEENSISILDVSMADEFLELGSGSSKKTKVLILDAVDKVKNFKYISFDISNKALQMCHNELKNISNDLKIELIQGDFFKELNVLKKSTKNRMFLFLGSTIGNFDNDTAINFLTSVSKVMNKNDTKPIDCRRKSAITGESSYVGDGQSHLYCKRFTRRNHSWKEWAQQASCRCGIHYG